MRHPSVRNMFRSSIAKPFRGRFKRESSRARTRGSEELVRFDRVSVRYNGRDILSHISWTIRRGESWALTGPNGSGKTTLLSLISGDNPQAYANMVYLFGRRRGTGESVWGLKKRIGSVSSELHLHFPDRQNCLQVVISGFHDSSGCYRQPSSAQRASARRILDRFGLGALAEQTFHSLSAGSQQMVLLARALVKSPDLLLLDEPCQGLDLAHRTMFLRLIESLLRHTDTTIIYVSHRQDEIPKGIRCFMKLRDGRVIGNSKN